MRPYSLERLQNMAAFAISMYSTISRVQKPFKGMQNSTYELIYPEKGLRAIGEKVRRMLPSLIDCACGMNCCTTFACSEKTVTDVQC